MPFIEVPAWKAIQIEYLVKMNYCEVRQDCTELINRDKLDEVKNYITSLEFDAPEV